jgi:hypothetical protein
VRVIKAVLDDLAELTPLAPLHLVDVLTRGSQESARGRRSSGGKPQRLVQRPIGLLSVKIKTIAPGRPQAPAWRRPFR